MDVETFTDDDDTDDYVPQASVPEPVERQPQQHPVRGVRESGSGGSLGGSGRGKTLPEVPDEGVLVQTMFCGVLPIYCSTSLSAVQISRTDYEVCGKVLSLGRAVSADCPIKDGDVVIVYPWTGCGCCEICSSGNSHLCEEEEKKNTEIGEQRISTDGSANDPEEKTAETAEGLSSAYCVVQHWKNVIRLPREIAHEVGCMLPYGALKVYAAILEARPVLEQAIRMRGFGNLLIVGGAGDGAELWAVILMKNVFCDKNVKVICADCDQGRLDHVTGAGADDAVLWKNDSSVEEMIEAATMSAYNKMDVAIDLVGDRLTFSAALQSLHYGGYLFQLGNCDSCQKNPTSETSTDIPANNETLPCGGLRGSSTRTAQVDLPLSLLFTRSLTVKAVPSGSRAQLKQLVDLVAVLGSTVKIPTEYYKVDELNIAMDKARRGDIKERVIITRCS